MVFVDKCFVCDIQYSLQIIYEFCNFYVIFVDCLAVAFHTILLIVSNF